MDEDQPLNTDSFAEMLGGESDNEQPEESDSQNDDEAQETTEESAQEGTEEGEQQEADEVADEEQAEQSEKDSAEATFEWEIDGEKVRVSEQEAKNGYLRHKDYTQRTQNFARERQEWSQHVARQAAEVQQFSQEIGQLQNIDGALAEYQAVDWETLRAEDPVSYAAHMADYQAMRARRGDVVVGIQQKQQALMAEQTAAQRQQLAQQTQEAQAHLAKIVPGFGKEHVAQMREFGQKVGFSTEELGQVGDKRMLEVLWKAAQYDKQQNTTQQAIKKVSALPTKASKPAPASKPAAQLHLEKQTRRLEQTGSAKDFAALLGMVPRK